MRWDVDHTHTGTVNTVKKFEVKAEVGIPVVTAKRYGKNQFSEDFM
jgi:hypothetical protein